VKDFQISYETSSWILAAFLISGAVMTPVSGKLSDIYGKKKVLLAVMGVYSAGVLAAGFATNITWMIAARVAMGVGFSAFPVAFGVIRESLPPSKLAIGQTVFGSTFTGGAVVGLVAGAWIIQTYGWHTSFFAIFPIAVLLTLIIWFFIKERPIPTVGNGMGPPGNMGKTPLDFKGIFLLAVTVVSSLTGISLVQNVSADPAVGIQIAGLLAVALVGLVLLIMVERRASFPLLTLKLLANRVMAPATVILMVVGTSTFMVYQTISILVQSPQPLGFGGDKFATAVVLLPFMIVLLIGTIGSGFILNRLGNVRMIELGTALSAVGFFGLLAFHSTELLVTVMLALIAAGLSFAYTGGFNIILLSSPMESTGIVLGMVLLLNLIFQSVGPAVAATFQQLYLGTVSGYPGFYPTAEAYYLIFLTSAILSLLSVAFSLYLARRPGVLRTWPQPPAGPGPS
jgi:MFS family permease